MFPVDSLRAVHLELSSYCNASCPMCPRTIDGGAINPRLYLAELKAQDIIRLFSDRIAAQLREIVLCGTYGEPTMARDFPEIVSFFREKSPHAKIHVETNGSVRTPDWWRRLGENLSGSGHLFSFGIDGLADTHSLYRRGTDHEKILANASAFIEGGGKARWSFIVFKHNEHQVEAARDLAMAMGFKSFIAKKTGRFFSTSPKKYSKRPYFEVLDTEGKAQYRLEPPSRREFLNSAVENAGEIALRHGSFESYLDKTPISCECLNRGKIYVAANQMVLPCSFLHHQFFDRAGSYGATQGQAAQMVDPQEVDGKTRSLEEILQSASFRRIMESWSRPSITEGRLKACAVYCGQEFDKVGTQIGGLYGVER